MTGATPKARAGDAIVCPRGHKAGHFTKDVPADGPIRLHMMVFDGPKLFKLQAYTCCDCEEPVAFLTEKGGAEWKVRTSLGWIECPPSAEVTILRFLTAHAHSSAAEIGIACAMTGAEIEAQIVMLNLRGLVLGQQDDAVPSRRVYRLTAEGRRKAGIVDARSSRHPPSPDHP